MSDAIVLGAATQQNLLSLQQINTQLSTTQGHLATGLKVGARSTMRCCTSRLSRSPTVRTI